MAVNVIGVRRKPPICHKTLKNIIVVLCAPRTTSVMIDAECIGSCKSNYHAIMTTTDPVNISTIRGNIVDIYNV